MSACLPLVSFAVSLYSAGLNSSHVRKSFPIGSSISIALSPGRIWKLCWTGTTLCWVSVLKLSAESIISPLVEEADCMFMRTSAFWLLKSGYIWMSSKWTLGVACNSIRPTIPFQLPWVWSVMLWESGPTLISLMRLSMRIVIRQVLPGVTAEVRSYTWGTQRLFCIPSFCWLTHTVVSMCGRSRKRVILSPFQLEGIVTFFWYQATPT